VAIECSFGNRSFIFFRPLDFSRVVFLVFFFSCALLLIALFCIYVHVFSL